MQHIKKLALLLLAISPFVTFGAQVGRHAEFAVNGVKAFAKCALNEARAFRSEAVDFVSANALISVLAAKEVAKELGSFAKAVSSEAKELKSITVGCLEAIVLSGETLDYVTPVGVKKFVAELGALAGTASFMDNLTREGRGSTSGMIVAAISGGITTLGSFAFLNL